MEKLERGNPKFIGGDDQASMLKQSLDQVILKYRKIDPLTGRSSVSLKGNTELRVKACIMLFLYAVPFCVLMYSPSGWLAILLLAILAFGKVGSALNIMHDAVHGAFSEKKWVNWIMSRTIYLQGDNLLNWQIQHNYFHHSYTNIHNLDEDIEPPEWLFRFSENSPWRKIHRYQHIIAPFFYGFLTLGRFFGEIGKLVSYHQQTLPKQYTFKLGWEIFKVSLLKIVYCFVTIVLPIIITDYSWWQVLLAFFGVHYFSSVLISFIFQSAHVVQGVEQYPEISEGENIEAHALVHQILTTCNFKTNKFFNWYSGGLNNQIEHHIFPRISHVHYKKFSPDIKRVISENNYPYNEENSFHNACFSHLRKLKQLGVQTQR